MRKKIALHNLGCKVNAYETEAMGQLLVQNGYELVPFSEKADIYIVNTCSVTNIADRKSRQMLHRGKKMNPDALVVAVGCYVQTAGAEAVLADGTVDIVVGNNRKKEIVEILKQYEREQAVNTNVVDIQFEKEYEALQIETVTEHTRAYIKVQDGCNQFCSYCIIPYARGRIRSRKQSEVLAEIRRLVKEGYQEIVMTGIHLSSYGTDRPEEGETLLSLLEAADKVEGIARIRLSSLEPRIITEEFMRRLSELVHICPHFHLSLQSGCDTVLKRMNRKYTTAEYAESCALIRRYFKEAAITTDIIVGFPGETEEEFAATKAFVNKIRFADVHIFPYSVRKGTVAAKMEGQIDGSVKHMRAELLEQECRKLTMEFRENLIGREKEVLFEQQEKIDGSLYMTGHTKEYVKIAVKTEEALENKIWDVNVTDTLNHEIMLAQLKKLY